MSTTLSLAMAFLLWSAPILSSDSASMTETSSDKNQNEKGFLQKLKKLKKDFFGNESSRKDNPNVSSHSKKQTKSNLTSSSSLHELLKQGKIQTCIESISDDSINVQDSSLKTILHLAVEQNSQELITELINRGANLAIKDNQDNTPLHIACIKNNVECALLLIKAQVPCTTYNRRGYTPLLISAQERNIKLCLLLLHSQADLSIGTLKEGNSPLHFAAASASSKNDSLVDLFVELGASGNLQNYAGKTPVDLALENDHFEIAAKLVNANRKLLLERSLCLACPEAVRILLSHRLLWVDLVFLDDITALHIIAAQPVNTSDLQQGLSYSGKKIKPQTRTTPQKDINSIFTMILDKQRLNLNQLDKAERTPLHVAAEWGRESNVAFILTKNRVNAVPNILQPCKTGYTPLMLAIAQNHAGIVKIFLDKLIEYEDEDSFISVYPDSIKLAIEQDSLDVLVCLLTYKKTYPHTSEYEVNYLLCRAAALGKLEACTILLEDIESINALSLHASELHDIEGFKDLSNALTPLECAIISGHKKVVKLLIKEGSSLEKGTNSDISPLALAVKRNHAELAVWLINKGAPLDTLALEIARPALGKELITAFRTASGGPSKLNKILHQTDATGKTLLHRAVLNAHPEKCLLLVDAGALLCIQDNEGRTPLHLACYEEYPDKLRYDKPCRTLQVLLSHVFLSRDVLDLKDTLGKTAAQYAEDAGTHAQVVLNFFEEATTRLAKALPASPLAKIRWENEDDDNE